MSTAPKTPPALDEAAGSPAKLRRVVFATGTMEGRNWRGMYDCDLECGHFRRVRGRKHCPTRLKCFECEEQENDKIRHDADSAAPQLKRQSNDK